MIAEFAVEPGQLWMQQAVTTVSSTVYMIVSVDHEWVMYLGPEREATQEGCRLYSCPTQRFLAHSPFRRVR